jgi:hypothetical protein
MQIWRTRRGRERLVRHHVPLVGAYRASIATAFAGLILFGLALIVGPIRVLRRGRLPAVSTDLRRDLGMLAASVGLVHSAVGLTVYPDVRLYFVFPFREWSEHLLPLRLDDLGIANYMGVAAAALLVLLLTISGDWALRRYGARR